MKVLQLVESLHRGSVERWLVRTMIRARKSGRPFDWTFYCEIAEPGEMEPAAVAAGARIVRSPVGLSNKLAFLSALRAELLRGQYDVIHSQHDLLSAAYYAGSVGIGCHRITHVHNTDEVLPTRSRWKRALALEPMRGTCLFMSDRIVATSHHALQTFLRTMAPNHVRDRVHYCSIEVEQYLSSSDDARSVRNELGLAADTKIVLFVGSMIDLKNPLFVIEMLPHLRKFDDRIIVVFAGVGPDEDRVKARALELHLTDHVRVLGWRDDIPRLMRGADLFVNPRRAHPLEGFGLVILEAQASRLRMLISEGISLEPVIDGSIYRQLRLASGAEAWAAEAIKLLQRAALSVPETRKLFQSSPFDPDFAIRDLHGIYNGLKKQGRSSHKTEDVPL